MANAGHSHNISDTMAQRQTRWN